MSWKAKEALVTTLSNTEKSINHHVRNHRKLLSVRKFPQEVVNYFTGPWMYGTGSGPSLVDVGWRSTHSHGLQAHEMALMAVNRCLSADRPMEHTMRSLRSWCVEMLDRPSSLFELCEWRVHFTMP